MGSKGRTAPRLLTQLGPDFVADAALGLVAHTVLVGVHQEELAQLPQTTVAVPLVSAERERVDLGQGRETSTVQKSETVVTGSEIGLDVVRVGCGLVMLDARLDANCVADHHARTKKVTLF